VSERFGLAAQRYQQSLSVCRLAIDQALERLAKEVLSRAHFSEGNPMTDDEVVYRTRLTIALGWLGAWLLASRVEAQENRYERELAVLFEKVSPKLLLWGEAAVPFFVALALSFESRGASARCENLLAAVISGICEKNGRRSKSAFGTPYEDVDTGIKRGIRLPLDEFGDPKTFVGFSYCTEAVVEMLARRLRKQLLRRLWPDITELTFCHFEPVDRWHWLLWWNERGTLKTTIPKRPERWSDLLERSLTRSTEILPSVLGSAQWLTGFFLLTYPHRFGPGPAALIDRSVGISIGQ
jgi:hypothetical protein